MKIDVQNKLFRLVFVLCFLSLTSSLVLPQTIKGNYKYERSATNVGKLLNKLKDEKLIKDVPKDFFDDVYDYTLPDLIFFINIADKPLIKKSEEEECKKLAPEEEIPYTKIVLVKNNDDKKRLFGEKYIYVMVFVAENESYKQSVKDTTGTYTLTEREITKFISEKPRYRTKTKEKYEKSTKLSVRHTYLKKMPGTGDFAFLSLAKGIASAFTGSVAEEKEDEEKEKAKPLPLEMFKVGCHCGERLLFGMVRVKLEDNSINRITILGFSEFIPIATFGNYSGSGFTSSVAVLITHLQSKTVEREGTNEWQGDPFLLCHFYARKPRMPYLRSGGESGFDAMVNKISFSFVVGTKLSENFFKFNDVFLGGCIGHNFYNNLGILIGVNLRTPIYPKSPPADSDIKGTEESKKNKRELQFAFGISYIF